MGLFRRKLDRDSSRGNHAFGHVYGANGIQEGRHDSGHLPANRERGSSRTESVNPLLSILRGLDLTQIFKTKGDLTRWSAKRTVGGLIASTACYDIIEHGITWPAVVLCAVAIVPLCISLGRDS